MLKIYNPRYLLRKGSSDMMKDVVKGHTVLLRVGEIAPAGKPMVRNPKTGNSGPQFNAVRNKVFKLVECTPEEIAKYEQQLKMLFG